MTSLTSLLLLVLAGPCLFSPRRGTEMAKEPSAQLSFQFAAANPSVTCEECKADVKSVAPASPAVWCDKALLPGSALDWLFNPRKSQALTDRVLARLVQLEAHEVNAHFKDDYRQAWITLSFAVNNVPDPFVAASYQIYGLHPDKVWPSIVADRKARLGTDYYDWYNSDDLLRPDVPKIPPTTADTPANGADALPQAIGPVPTRKEVV